MYAQSITVRCIRSLFDEIGDFFISNIYIYIYIYIYKCMCVCVCVCVCVFTVLGTHMYEVYYQNIYHTRYRSLSYTHTATYRRYISDIVYTYNKLNDAHYCLLLRIYQTLFVNIPNKIVSYMTNITSFCAVQMNF